MEEENAPQTAAASKQISHDDVYKAVFDLVGQKPNETYEDLTKVLPSIKDSDPAEVKELAARKALRDLYNPPKDPLLVEYERAAAEEEVDDLSTEDGEWLGANKKSVGGEDDEELDEHGIPVMKLSRASSGFILDGPGDVKVDNFTPEEAENAAGGADVEAASLLVPGRTAAAATAAATASGALAGSAVGTSGRASIAQASGGGEPPSYVPSVLSRRAPTAAAAMVSAAAPVTTLEDEIRGLSVTGDATRRQQQPTLQHLQQIVSEGVAARPAGGEGSGRVEKEDKAKEEEVGIVEDKEREEEEEVEIVDEPPAVLLPVPTGRTGASDGGVSGGGDGSPLAGVAAPPGVLSGGDRMVANGQVVASQGAGYSDDTGTSLPGTCQDTSEEDALWAALQGLDGRALVEHMGLADGAVAGSSGAEESEAAAIKVEPQASSSQEEEADIGPASTTPEKASAGPLAPSGSGSDSSGVDPHVGKRADAVQPRTGAGGDPAATAAIPSPPVFSPESEPTGNVAREPSPEGGGQEGASGPAGGERQLVVAGNGPSSAGGGDRRSRRQAPPEGDDRGPTFEAVESFSLDPDFDYDNVVLTPREFPYSMLTARRAAGFGGVAPAPR